MRQTREARPKNRNSGLINTLAVGFGKFNPALRSVSWPGNMAHADTGYGETSKLLLDFNHPPGAVIEGRRIYLPLF